MRIPNWPLAVIVSTALLAACKPETATIESAEPSPAAKPAPSAVPPASAQPAPQAPTPGPVHSGGSTASNALPPGHPPVGSDAAKPTRTAPGMTGTVLEQIPAGKYLYLKLKTGEGEHWTAVLTRPVENGSTVTVSKPYRMKNFKSPSLGRTFDEIYFGTLADAAATPTPTAAPAPRPSALVTKADGDNALRIEEVYARRTELKGKTVRIRGLVTKFNAEILGSNWIHLQDGSGSAQAGNNDLTVTTKGTAAVGDEVMISGVISLDRDFGAGYSYGVIVENATVEPTK